MKTKQLCWCGNPAQAGRREGRPLCDKHYKQLVRAREKQDPVAIAVDKAKTVRRLNRKAARVLGNILNNLNGLIDSYAESSTKYEDILADLRTMQQACGVLRPLHDMAMDRMMQVNADLEEQHDAAAD